MDDDVILEIKEEAAGTPSPVGAAFADPQARLRTLVGTLLARADSAPTWGAATYEGLPVQVRAERACEKTLRVHRLVGARGTPAALEGVAAVLGRLLARMHASALPGGQSPAARIVAALDTDPSHFVSALADAAVAYADRVTSDQALLRDALATEGPRLGVTATELSVNEVAVDGPDWIELAAGTAGPFVDLTDLAITDSDGAGAPNGAHAVALPDGLRIPAGGYFLVLAKVSAPVAGITPDCTLAGVPACVQVGFGLSGSAGDGAFVLDASAGTVASAAVPAGAVPAGSGRTFGRVPDRTGALGLTQATPDAANRAAP